MAAVVIYKKYANRRIYDTQSSRYVTLDELADAIRQGRQVQVIDAKTKDDVTAFVLTQIVLEQAKRKNILLPSPVLHLIIRYGDNVLLDFFETYLQQIVHNYIQYKRSVDDQFQRWLDLGMGLTSQNPGESSELNPFAAFFRQNSSTSDDDDR
ncbi:MAG: polyhydroxyalkanoate synthesis regulator DNA-binding domain-containing protein [Desulfobacterales bacterium]|jgi:polyhydroxyalkanoate synthesis repressor PhaR